MKVKIGRKNLAIKDCKGIKSVKGLMFSEMQDIDGAMIYANNIWMPFVKHELDLLFLDENYKIIEVQSAKIHIPQKIELENLQERKGEILLH